MTHDASMDAFMNHSGTRMWHDRNESDQPHHADRVGAVLRIEIPTEPGVGGRVRLVGQPTDVVFWRSRQGSYGWFHEGLEGSGHTWEEILRMRDGVEVLEPVRAGAEDTP